MEMNVETTLTYGGKEGTTPDVIWWNLVPLWFWNDVLHGPSASNITSWTTYAPATSPTSLALGGLAADNRYRTFLFSGTLDARRPLPPTKFSY